MRPTRRFNPVLYLFLLSLFILWLVSCQRPDPQVVVVATQVPLAIPPTLAPATPSANGGEGAAGDAAALISPPTPAPATPTQVVLRVYIGTPTPDAPRNGSANTGGAAFTHTVGFGENLGLIAQTYGLTVEQITQANGIGVNDFLYVGQALLIPGSGSVSGLVSPSFKIIPDSELVYGPAAEGFHVADVAAAYRGYLVNYTENIEGQVITGPEVVALVAHRFSINPRLLLALLDYRAGWLTQPNPTETTYPLRYYTPGTEGLYKQLGWAANELNLGFYGRAEGGRYSFTLADGTQLAFAPDINDGTAALQQYLGASGSSYATWQQEVGPEGFFRTFDQLFGNPFAYTFEPILPSGLTQPPLRFPWPLGETWYYTGGPHGGWASGSAWAALDFAPPGEQLGCYQDENWITAVADGVVTRSGFGAVVVDLDGDGYAGTGWAITYMHLETRDRVAVGTIVKAGDKLGHASCEGGFSTATHLHISRTYNGRWIAADGAIAFNMGGWVSQGQGVEYFGLFFRGDAVKEACECREEGNALLGE
ncbi:MAG: LysM peptidoglycan-binding domain-containing M23 family metallopeptidase [Chloroflexi bacterium]|nr:LysM peptidoglycan-binding domain-containing M23 family metallopeptidase [Chloroflexota bacterium]